MEAGEPALNAPRMSNAPDPRLEGRAVYVVAIQMPNITSYSGSWLVWFAEHERANGRRITMTAPVPIRKVDPKYIVSARQDRVEGAVRLFAIIRKTGQVDSVELLRHLDDRLDRSATEALTKWEFEPAKADGVPVDVEAVFEIPFHLAPRAAR
jgi:TonB family protein